MLKFWSIIALGLSLAGTANAQLECALAAQDDAGCVRSFDNNQQHCAWCSVAGFAFCATEEQAEAAEQALGAHCHRYSGDDDDAVATDDDDVAPTDDAIPDDFWTCLQKKTSEDCLSAGCTWCDGKSGYGLCMDGPTADSADESDFFQCTHASQKISMVAPLADSNDPTCMLAYLADETEQNCVQTKDLDGDACQWCSLAGITNLCLNPDQADLGSTLGITCDAQRSGGLRTPQQPDPYDPSCALAFLMDQTPDACEAAVDENGAPCKFCSLQDMDLCMTELQAEAGEQLGMECADSTSLVSQSDLYDPSCVLSESTDYNECIATHDQDGLSCQWCHLQGTADLCLTATQADLGQQLGIWCDSAGSQANDYGVPDDFTECLSNMDENGCAADSCTWCNTQVGMGFCLSTPVAEATKDCTFFDCIFADSESMKVKPKSDTYDPSCALAFLVDQSKASCEAAVDEDGAPCKFCSLQGAMDMCLSEFPAEAGEQMGITCDGDADIEFQQQPDPYDPSCALAFLMDQSKASCTAAVDENGEPCKFCSLQGAMDMCLTEFQAEAGEQMGVTCDDETHKVDQQPDPYDPSCALAFLQDQSKVTCVAAVDEDGHPCRFCSLQGELDMCLTDFQSEAAAQFGVECDALTAVVKENNAEDIYDTMCLTAGMSEQNPNTASQVCEQAIGRDGGPCIWCDAAGVFGLCLSSDQALAAGNYLQCGAQIATE